VTDVVMAFMSEEESTQKALVTMTIDDVDHYTPEERAAIIASYPEHEREARTRGIPIMGSGRVFPIEESVISEGAIQIPSHWPRIAGIDFGWEHPTAVVWMAWDRDTDTVHVYDAYRKKEQGPIVHAATIKAKGGWIPVAWPHDGNNETAAGAGVNLAKQYKQQGVNILHQHAQFPPQPDGKVGGYSTEAGVIQMYDRMMTGRLKVASHLSEWWEEFRLYHRDEGKIVKVRDDLISATRYAMMMLRFAKVQQINNPFGEVFNPLFDPEVAH
jgi:hypothetical protein